MKKLTIGRNNECDIIIADTSDLVSRKQAVLAYSFWGKMKLYDTSNNGTFVNGGKLESGKGLPVTRKDKINFAHIADLDWNEVKDLYHKTKMIYAICTVFAIIIVSLMTFILSRPDTEDTLTIEKSEMSTIKGETTTTIKPQVVKEKPISQPSYKKRKKNNTKYGKTKKGKAVTPEAVTNKEMNEKSPIIY